MTTSLEWAHHLRVFFHCATKVTDTDKWAEIDTINEMAQWAIRLNLSLADIAKAMVEMECSESLIGHIIYEYHRQLKQKES